MKIALLTEKYTPDIGGLAISTGRLGHLLASAGHSVRVFAPTSSLPPSEKRMFVHEGITVNRFGVHKRVDDTLVDWFEFIAGEHKREPFDVLHAYFLTQAGFVAAYAGKYLGLPSAVSARGNDLERAIFDPARAAHIFYALEHANAVTVNTRELAKKAEALVPELKVTLVPNGIDTDHFQPTPRNEALAAQLGLGREKIPVIGFVGELREKKGLSTLLNGYAKITKACPAVLLIVGDVRPGDDKQTFDALRTTIPEARIIVTGYVSPQDLPGYYALMDIFVMPSLRDGLPNALLEAMACEKAVVAASVGGMLDVLKDGENGKLVPAKDPSVLADAIHSLLTTEARAQEYGQAARKTILDQFTLKSELEANLRVYRQLGIPL